MHPLSTEPTAPQTAQEPFERRFAETSEWHARLQRVRDAIRKANPEGRDLVAELIAERRREAEHG